MRRPRPPGSRACFHLLSLLACCAPLAGCKTFSPPSAEVAAELVAQFAEPAAVEAPSRRRAVVELESAHVSGLFEAVLVTSGGPRPSARLQLLAEVGGKLLDLALVPERIVGYLPPAGIALDHARTGGEPPPRHLLSFLAASLLEELTPLTPERIRGVRADRAGRELDLVPGLEGVRVHARVDAAGQLVEREYRLRGVRWRERWEGEQRIFEGGGFRWSLRELAVETIDAPPATLYELELPAGLRQEGAVPRS